MADLGLGVPKKPVVINSIWDWQASTKPEKPFVGMKMTGGEMTAFTDQRNPDDTDTLYLEGSRRFQVQWECFSNAENEFAEYMALALQTAFQQPQYYDQTIALGGNYFNPVQPWSCSVTRVQPLQDVTMPLDNVLFERRVIVEFSLLVSIHAPLQAPAGTPGAGEIIEVKSNSTVDGVSVIIDATKP